MENHRVLLSVIVFGAIVGMLFFSKPSITGFVPTETYSQTLNLEVTESQRFVLESDGESLKLSSFGITGTVSGRGLVNVYLSDGVQRWLVYTNKKKPGSSMEHITGLAVQRLDISPGEKLNSIETLPEGYTTGTGAFNNECRESCILDEDLFSKPYLYLDVIIEPGATLHISEIVFASMSE